LHGTVYKAIEFVILRFKKKEFVIPTCEPTLYICCNKRTVRKNNFILSLLCMNIQRNSTIHHVWLLIQIVNASSSMLLL